MTSKHSWQQLDSRIVYQNPWIKVREDKVVRPNGQPGIYGVVMTPPSVMIVPLTENGEVYMIGQNRYPTEKFSWELPAGGSDNQNLLTAAKRELKEETGLEAGSWEEIGSFQVMNGICSEICHVFIARELRATPGNSQDEEGITTVRIVAFSELLAMIRSGECDDGMSIAAIMQAALYLGILKQG
ncbi:NUDIX hydrolase [Patescibacteria group bacterium]|nr:NUDIX hydrolase [Patescibacteria group bacterium]